MENKDISLCMENKNIYPPGCTHDHRNLRAYKTQSWAPCYDCFGFGQDSKGACIHCLNTCHKGHKIGRIRTSLFFCTCGINKHKPFNIQKMSAKHNNHYPTYGNRLANMYYTNYKFWSPPPMFNEYEPFRNNLYGQDVSNQIARYEDDYNADKYNNIGNEANSNYVNNMDDANNDITDELGSCEPSDDIIDESGYCEPPDDIKGLF